MRVAHLPPVSAQRVDCILHLRFFGAIFTQRNAPAAIPFTHSTRIPCSEHGAIDFPCAVHSQALVLAVVIKRQHAVWYEEPDRRAPA